MNMNTRNVNDNTPPAASAPAAARTSTTSTNTGTATGSNDSSNTPSSSSSKTTIEGDNKQQQQQQQQHRLSSQQQQRYTDTYSSNNYLSALGNKQQQQKFEETTTAKSSSSSSSSSSQWQYTGGSSGSSSSSSSGTTVNEKQDPTIYSEFTQQRQNEDSLQQQEVLSSSNNKEQQTSFRISNSNNNNEYDNKKTKESASTNKERTTTTTQPPEVYTSSLKSETSTDGRNKATSTGTSKKGYLESLAPDNSTTSTQKSNPYSTPWGRKKMDSSDDKKELPLAENTNVHRPYSSSTEQESLKHVTLSKSAISGVKALIDTIHQTKRKQDDNKNITTSSNMGSRSSTSTNVQSNDSKNIALQPKDIGPKGYLESLAPEIDKSTRQKSPYYTPWGRRVNNNNITTTTEKLWSKMISSSGVRNTTLEIPTTTLVPMPLTKSSLPTNPPLASTGATKSNAIKLSNNNNKPNLSLPRNAATTTSNNFHWSTLDNIPQKLKAIDKKQIYKDIVDSSATTTKLPKIDTTSSTFSKMNNNNNDDFTDSQQQQQKRSNNVGPIESQQQPRKTFQMQSSNSNSQSTAAPKPFVGKVSVASLDQNYNFKSSRKSPYQTPINEPILKSKQYENRQQQQQNINNDSVMHKSPSNGEVRSSDGSSSNQRDVPLSATQTKQSVNHLQQPPVTKQQQQISPKEEEKPVEAAKPKIKGPVLGSSPEDWDADGKNNVIKALDEAYMGLAVAVVMSDQGGTPAKSRLGAVLVGEDGSILGEAHSDYKTNAIWAVVEMAGLDIRPSAEWVINWPESPTLKNKMATSTLYLTSEPSASLQDQGWPPITDLIVKAGISRVVIGAPNMTSKARGGEALYSAGIQVNIGRIMAEECIALSSSDDTGNMADKADELARRQQGLMETLSHQSFEELSSSIKKKTDSQESNQTEKDLEKKKLEAPRSENAGFGVSNTTEEASRSDADIALSETMSHESKASDAVDSDNVNKSENVTISSAPDFTGNNETQSKISSEVGITEPANQTDVGEASSVDETFSEEKFEITEESDLEIPSSQDDDDRDEVTKALDGAYMELAVAVAMSDQGISGLSRLGAVLVGEDGSILGEAHSDYKTNAIWAVVEMAGLDVRPTTEWVINWADSPVVKDRLASSTLYLTSEPSPCLQEQGWPPITDLIVSAGISRVVIGAPYPSSGKHADGAKVLEAAGIEVSLGKTLLEECMSLSDDNRGMADRAGRLAQRHEELFKGPNALAKSLSQAVPKKPKASLGKNDTTVSQNFQQETSSIDETAEKSEEQTQHVLISDSDVESKSSDASRSVNITDIPKAADLLTKEEDVVSNAQDSVPYVEDSVPNAQDGVLNGEYSAPNARDNAPNAPASIVPTAEKFSEEELEFLQDPGRDDRDKVTKALDEVYMELAIAVFLSDRGDSPATSKLGAVLVSDEGDILGEAYSKYEKDAVWAVAEMAGLTVHGKTEWKVDWPPFSDLRKKLTSSTLYLTSEPSAYDQESGLPPITDLITKMGVPRVVIGAPDLTSDYPMKGAEVLQSFGVDVSLGRTLLQDCLSLSGDFLLMTDKADHFAQRYQKSLNGLLQTLSDEDNENDGNAVVSSDDSILALLPSAAPASSNESVHAKSPDEDDEKLQVRAANRTKSESSNSSFSKNNTIVGNKKHIDSASMVVVNSTDKTNISSPDMIGSVKTPDIVPSLSVDKLDRGDYAFNDTETVNSNELQTNDVMNRKEGQPPLDSKSDLRHGNRTTKPAKESALTKETDSHQLALQPSNSSHTAMLNDSDFISRKGNGEGRHLNSSELAITTSKGNSTITTKALGHDSKKDIFSSNSSNLTRSADMVLPSKGSALKDTNDQRIGTSKVKNNTQSGKASPRFDAIRLKDKESPNPLPSTTSTNSTLQSPKFDTEGSNVMEMDKLFLSKVSRVGGSGEIVEKSSMTMITGRELELQQAREVTSFNGTVSVLTSEDLPSLSERLPSTKEVNKKKVRNNPSTKPYRGKVTVLSSTGEEIDSFITNDLVNYQVKGESEEKPDFLDNINTTNICYEVKNNIKSTEGKSLKTEKVHHDRKMDSNHTFLGSSNESNVTKPDPIQSELSNLNDLHSSDVLSRSRNFNTSSDQLDLSTSATAQANYISIFNGTVSVLTSDHLPSLSERSPSAKEVNRKKVRNKVATKRPPYLGKVTIVSSTGEERDSFTNENLLDNLISAELHGNEINVTNVFDEAQSNSTSEVAESSKTDNVGYVQNMSSNNTLGNKKGSNRLQPDSFRLESSDLIEINVSNVFENSLKHNASVARTLSPKDNAPSLSIAEEINTSMFNGTASVLTTADIPFLSERVPSTREVNKKAKKNPLTKPYLGKVKVVSSYGKENSSFVKTDQFDYLANRNTDKVRDKSNTSRVFDKAKINVTSKVAELLETKKAQKEQNVSSDLTFLGSDNKTDATRPASLQSKSSKLNDFNSTDVLVNSRNVNASAGQLNRSLIFNNVIASDSAPSMDRAMFNGTVSVLTSEEFPSLPEKAPSMKHVSQKKKRQTKLPTKPYHGKVTVISSTGKEIDPSLKSDLVDYHVNGKSVEWERLLFDQSKALKQFDNAQTNGFTGTGKTSKSTSKKSSKYEKVYSTKGTANMFKADFNWLEEFKAEENEEGLALDEAYMELAIAVAMSDGGESSATASYPNPTVGAVLVTEDGEILGEAYSDYRTNAIQSVFEQAGLDLRAMKEWVVSWPSSSELRKRLASSTLYVTLEPSADRRGESGPPITDLIEHAGVSRIVIGAPDPILEKRGKGAATLQSAGIKVSIGRVLPEKCCELIVNYSELANSKFHRKALAHYESFGRPMGFLHCSVVDSDKIEEFLKQGNSFSDSFGLKKKFDSSVDSFELAPPPDAIWYQDEYNPVDDSVSGEYQRKLGESPAMPWYKQADAVVATFPRKSSGPPGNDPISARLSGLIWLATHGRELPAAVERVFVLDAADLVHVPLRNDDPNLPEGVNIEEFWEGKDRKPTRIILRFGGRAESAATVKDSPSGAMQTSDIAARSDFAMNSSKTSKHIQLSAKQQNATKSTADLVERQPKAVAQLRKQFEEQGVIVETIKGGLPVDVMYHLGEKHGFHSVVWRAGYWRECDTQAIMEGAFQRLSAHLAVNATGGRFWQLMVAENAVQAACGPRSKVKVFSDQEDISLKYCDEHLPEMAGNPVRHVCLDCRVALLEEDSRSQESSQENAIVKKTSVEEASWFF